MGRNTTANQVRNGRYASWLEVRIHRMYMTIARTDAQQKPLNAIRSIINMNRQSSQTSYPPRAGVSATLHPPAPTQVNVSHSRHGSGSLLSMSLNSCMSLTVV